MPLPMPDQDPQPSVPHSELATFGEELRREREIRGISMKEIADATKISKRFLEAIERNDHKTLPAPVFTRGFVREYARYLGLNADDMVNRYNFAAAGDDRIEKPPPHPIPQPIVEAPKKPRERRGIPPAFLRINANFIFVAILAAALITATWWAVQWKKQRDAEARLAETNAAPIVTAPKIAPPPPVTDTQPLNDDTLRLVVEVNDRAWVAVWVDGKKAEDAVLPAGETRTFEAKEGFKFSTGNAAGVSLKLNDTAIPAVGDGGDGEVVKNVVFDRPYLQSLRGRTPSQP